MRTKQTLGKFTGCPCTNDMINVPLQFSEDSSSVSFAIDSGTLRDINDVATIISTIFRTYKKFYRLEILIWEILILFIVMTKIAQLLYCDVNCYS